MFSNEFPALSVAAMLAISTPLHAQTAPAGAAGASAAAGTISAGEVFSTVAGLALISALTSGSSGYAVNLAAATQSSTTAAASATVAHTQTTVEAANVRTAIDVLATAAGALATTDNTVKTALSAANTAHAETMSAASAAKTAADNLAKASALPAVWVCAAVSCTRADLTSLTASGQLLPPTQHPMQPSTRTTRRLSSSI